jgi:hypothetical protein
MSGLQLNVNGIILSAADKLAKDLGRDSFCLKSCVEISETRLRSKETDCFNNCLSVYKKFENSYQVNFYSNK